MTQTLSALLPDFGKLMQNPLGLIMYGFVLLGAAALGAVLTGVVGRYSAVLFWKDLSRGAILRLRLLGGVGGAVAAYALLGTGGGFGFGPGPGGLPGGKGPGTGDANRLVSLADQANTPAKNDTTKLDSRAPVVLRIIVLGPETKPPLAEPDRFFAVATDEAPEAMNVDQVVGRIRKTQGERQVQEVELIISEDSSLFGRPLVQELRKRVLQELRVPFSQPNFDGDPLRERSRFEPPKEL